MTRLCGVLNCGLPTSSRFAGYCRRHQANQRRHGHVHQRAVSKAHTRPYIATVRARIAKNAHSPAWITLDDRWRALVEHAKQLVSKFERGVPCSRFEKIAAYEVLKLGGNVLARAVVEMTIAMVLMRELDPRSFVSDQAFWVQMARRVRGLTDLNYGERYIHSTGEVKRCYRELSPRAAIVLGRWLAETLGIGGLHIARLERADSEKAISERRSLHDALSNLS